VRELEFVGFVGVWDEVPFGGRDVMSWMKGRCTRVGR
jgi:hypothetical protein